MRGYVRRCNRRKRNERGVLDPPGSMVYDGFAADRSLAELVSSYRFFAKLR